MRKRTVTTIEMHQVMIVRRRSGAAHAWCPACLKEVEMATLEEAAFRSHVSLHDICRRIGNGDIQLIETADGTLICLASLPHKFSLGEGGLNADGAEIPSTSSSDQSDTAQPPTSSPEECKE